MKKDNVHNLYEYQFAKKMVEEIPQILIDLDNCFDLLYNHIDYKDVLDVIYAMADAKFYLQLHYVAYKDVYDKKGKV